MTEVSIEKLSGEDVAAHVDHLADMLHACVHSGASVGFILPFTQQDSRRFWRTLILPSAKTGGCVVFVARDDDRIVGTVQLGIDTPANQPHRCEVSKLLVHPDCRNRGIARRLMDALQQEAVRLDKGLITLDTRTGDHAEPLYHSLGYKVSGVIPGFALDPSRSRFDPTTIMYKVL